MPPRLLSQRLILLTLVAALLGACGDTIDWATTTPATAPATTTTTTTITPPPAPFDVQTEIDWFVEILNGEELGVDEYESRFADEFRQQVSFEAIQPILDEFRPGAPFTVVDRSGEGARGEAVIESATGRRARILAELNDRTQFSTLLIQPTEAPTLDDPPTSVGEAFDRLAGLGQVRASTAELVDGSCGPIDSVSSGEPAPLGSVFKLYVLAALGDAVAAGDVAWDDTVIVQEDLKSIPTGELQDRESGSEVTVLETAQLMISISDNTAADHLIALLGRGTVETTQSRYGNTTPELNTPFLTTREFAALKVGPASGLRDPQWIEGDEAERRAILSQISDMAPADISVQDWVDPVDPDTVEWFASPDDLCDLALDVIDLSETVPEIGQILEMNPGVPAEAGTWDRVWFKGGSEPGLLAVWWGTEVDGRVFVTSGSVVNPEEAFDPDLAVLLFAAARDLSAP
jgi:hypothetical protein